MRDITPLTDLQREFLAWLKQQRLAIPVEPVHNSRRALELRFPSLGTTQIVGKLVEASHEINVAVYCGSELWDFLFCNDGVIPALGRNGWFCTTCRSQAIRRHQRCLTYPTREALWREHMFEPFLTWVNNKLARADSFALCGSLGDFAWACLLPNDPDRRLDLSGCKLVPLRSGEHLDFDCW